jgi:PAS domain S-box-containing protein
VKALTKKATHLRKAVGKNFGRRKGERSRPKGASKTSRELVSASTLRTAVEDAVRTRQELATELADMARLHELSTRLFASTALQPLLEEILDATMSLLNADFGSVQLYNPQTKMLEFVAHRGFRREFFDYFNGAHEGTSACGMAFQRGKRVIMEDVLTEPGFAPHLKIVAAAGFRAVQATPLFSRTSEVLGVISTHFRKPHRPPERELRFVDLYARQAAEMIERKRAEEALRASEERFRRYFELGLIGMGITSPSKGILEVNDELCRILGYSREELLEKTWAELTHPDDLPQDVFNFDRVMAGEIEGYSLEKRWIRKDGQIINGIMAAKCHRRPDGSVDYFVGLLQDITMRKRREEEQRKLASLVENSNDFIGLASLEGDVLYVNNAGRKMAGLDGEGAITIFDFAMEEDRAFVAEEMLPQIEKDGEWEGEMPMRHFQTGAPIPMHVNAFVIKEEGTGRPLALATISRDISERKEAEQKLHETQAELAHVTRLNTLGEIGSSIAHEINQPLGAIVNNSNVGLKLMGRRGFEERIREVLVDIANDAIRASSIITRIRALTKRSTAEKTSFSVEDLVDEVLALAHQTANKAEVNIKNLVPARLRLRADRVQLQQMLLNLVMNGIQAMSATPEKKRTLTLQAKPQKLDGKPMITISVKDCGPGFTPEAASRLFEPFFTTKSNGMGLGLAISRSIAEAHGGRLWAEPNTCPGATFHCALPAKEAKKSRVPKGAKS